MTYGSQMGEDSKQMDDEFERKKLSKLKADKKKLTARVKDLEAEVERLEKAGKYFIAEFDENWYVGRLSIDAKSACDALRKIIFWEHEQP